MPRRLALSLLFALGCSHPEPARIAQPATPEPPAVAAQAPSPPDAAPVTPEPDARLDHATLKIFGMT